MRSKRVWTLSAVPGIPIRSCEKERVIHEKDNQKQSAESCTGTGPAAGDGSGVLCGRRGYVYQHGSAAAKHSADQGFRPDD